MSRRRYLIILFVMLVLFSPIVGTVFAGRIINVEADGSGDYPTIQAAINASANGDVVIAAPGTYTGDGNRDIDYKGKVITVRSTESNDPCIVSDTMIDCNGTAQEMHRGFLFQNGEDSRSVLDGFTVINAYASYGGGIYCRSSSPTTRNCTFRGNFGSVVGGGMYNYNSSPTLINCVFRENSATREGGGMYNENYSSATIVNCTFNGNFSIKDQGGGMYNEDRSSPTLTGCIFSGNSARMGGAMANEEYSKPKLTDCTFTGNWVTGGGQHGKGGAMNNYNGSSATLRNCIFTTNSASNRGGQCIIRQAAILC